MSVILLNQVVNFQLSYSYFSAFTGSKLDALNAGYIETIEVIIIEQNAIKKID